MGNTTHLNLAYMEASQAQKEVTVNEALTSLDALIQLSVKDRNLATPPISPSEGDRYIIANSATGDWAGHEGKIALYFNSGWLFYVPKIGWRAYIVDESLTVTYTASGWSIIAQNVLINEPSGEYFKILRKEVDVALSAGTTFSVNDFIEDRALVFGIHTRVMSDITGPASFNVGITGSATKFGSTIGISEDSTNVGVINPEAFFANTPLRITVNGSAFTGGNIKIIQHYAMMRGNWSW